MTQIKMPYIENTYEESADLLNNNAIIKLEPMDSEVSDDDEVFDTKFATSVTSNVISKSLNNIHASEEPLERPNSLAIRTDEHLSYNDNAVSTANRYPQQPFILHRVVR